METAVQFISAVPIGGIIGIIVAALAILLSVFGFVVSRYKKCPSDKVMIIYGKIGNNQDGTSRSSKCIHGGASFIIPFFQAYSFLDLTPMSIGVDLKNTLCRQNIRIDVPSRFTVGISTEAGVMQNAAERLRGLRNDDIQDLAKEIILGQLRLVVALMDIEEINSDRDKFLEAISRNVEGELKKIGLRLINVNITDISDERGYIDALGKEAAAKAIRDGEIGEAKAVEVQRVEVAAANSRALEGENESLATISRSNAKRREAEAEAEKTASIAEMIAEANANKAGYEAEREAELSRANREKSTLEADVIVKAEIEKRRLELQAEAEAEMVRRKARGDADAVLMQKQAEAAGIYAVLEKQALGFEKIVKASGGLPDDAVKMLMADNMENLMRVQVEAIKNLKIDKINVWDSGNNNSKEGSTTSNFISSLVKSVPPMQEMYKMVGMKMPEFLGTVDESFGAKISEVKEIEEVKEVKQVPKTKK